MGYSPVASIGFGVELTAAQAKEFSEEPGECKIKGFALGFLGDSRAGDYTEVLVLEETQHECAWGPETLDMLQLGRSYEELKAEFDERLKGASIKIRKKPRWLIWSAIV